ncbi:hypothetical protein M3Y99_00340300 [Aphelenchoides fujianensis]|nr:hypothetical protein M3Y99_00340300 [Aphelenchoides fujianensis]
MQVCVREHIIELFSFYGPLTGVTYSKSGYAFVQFARPEDAENARLNLDNYFFQAKRLEDEPSVFRCFHCEETCRNSWDLILHMSQKHKISLYRDNSQQMTVEYPTHFND